VILDEMSFTILHSIHFFYKKQTTKYVYIPLHLIPSLSTNPNIEEGGVGNVEFDCKVSSVTKNLVSNREFLKKGTIFSFSKGCYIFL
jgi:hypothetical protein